MRPKKIDCIDNHPDFCGDILCDLQVISRQEIDINLGCNILKPFYQITFMGVMYMKQGAIYKRFGPEFVGDFCDAMKNRNNIVMNSIIKQISVKNKHIVHTCPFVGPHFVRNLTISEAFGLSALPQGDYRMELRLADKMSNKTLIHTRMYFYVKAIDPLKDFRNVFDFKFV